MGRGGLKRKKENYILREERLKWRLRERTIGNKGGPGSEEGKSAKSSGYLGENNASLKNYKDLRERFDY